MGHSRDWMLSWEREKEAHEDEIAQRNSMYNGHTHLRITAVNRPTRKRKTGIKKNSSPVTVAISQQLALF